MITKTIGTGGDYATIALAQAYIASIQPYPDDLTITQVGDIHETGVYSSSPYPNMGTHTVTWDFSHDFPVYLEGAGCAFFRSQGGSIIVNNIKIIHAGSTYGILIRFDPAGATGLVTFQIENFILDGNNATTGANNRHGIYTYDSGKNVKTIIKQGKIYNCGCGVFLQSFTNGAVNAEKIIENVSVYDCGFYGTAQRAGVYIEDRSDGLWTVRNVAAFHARAGTATDWVIESLPVSYITFENCADSDGTCPAHTGLQANIVPADQFISLDSTSADFLKPKTTGLLGYSGTTPTYVTEDIAGLPIPNGAGQIPIGCHALEYTPPPTPAPISTTKIFPYLPDWGGAIISRYKFTTGLSVTRRLHEQRSSMYFKPRRSFSCQFVLQNDQAAHLWHFLLSVRASVFLFPIISEPLISNEPDTVLYDGFDLYPLEPLTDYHNTNRIDLTDLIQDTVLLYDIAGVLRPEGAIITDIVTRGVPASPDGAKISTLGWTRAFTRGGAVAYPGVPVLLSEKRKRNITDSTIEISVTVDEVPGYNPT